MSESAFLSWLSERHQSRPSVSLEGLISSTGGAESVAVVVVDLVEGFCRQGPLASDRILATVEPIAEFLRRADQAGVKEFLFPCDAHSADSPEFQAFPPHCVKGSTESDLVKEIEELPFSHQFQRLEKGSVSSLVGTDLTDRLAKGESKTIVCCGDCTDLCLYHLAVGLRFHANHHGLRWRVIVSQNLVATYDLPLGTATEIGALPHPAGLLSRVFLYHLELNGVEVVASID